MADAGAFFQLVKQAAAAAKAKREAAGLSPLQEKSYRGVRWHFGKYGAEIRDPLDSERAWLGSYATAEEAAYAYDIAARVVQGKRARPNFPEPPPGLGEEDGPTADVVIKFFAELRNSRVVRAHKRARTTAAESSAAAAAMGPCAAGANNSDADADADADADDDE
ncbi:hypothetical protein BAE44_0016787 [Dichanthelium oligosanthes]|uniref:AP2/ERF domain-containing protein n=1 Tax=Dichanthelium oligosanthes TaxID=888268 RepID=A0A1E5VB04_9POAL|nr:hypothetical protein BAE44_0016787 [Dichanthelium oligosanthes]